MKFLVSPFLTLLLFSCQNKPGNETNAPVNRELIDIITDTVHTDSSGPAKIRTIFPPNKEDAETLVAIYYSARNRELKYSYYKGLGLEILDVYPVKGTDSFLVEAKVSGRKWPNPNKDTLTIPFEEKRTIRTIRTNDGWQADSIGIK